MSHLGQMKNDIHTAKHTPDVGHEAGHVVSPQEV